MSSAFVEIGSETTRGLESAPNVITSGATESTPLLQRGQCIDSLTHTTEDVDKTTIFRQELQTILSYALPVFGAQVVEHSLVFVPVISVGHLSTTALAAISLGSMTAAVTGLSMLQGLSSALDTLLPTTWTSPQPHLMGLWAQRMWVVLLSAMVPIVFVWFHAEQILLALKQDPDVARLAAVYLRCFSFGLPAYGFNLVSRRYFQSQGLFSLQTWIICFVAPINIFLNYLLVWGPEAIRLGFIGAPVATAVSYSLISLVSLIYGIFYVPHTGWHPISSQMFTHLDVVARLGLSGIGQIASEWWAWELVALAASFLGPIALASQSILLTSSSTLFQAPYGLSNAAAIRVGNLLGEKKAKRAEVATNAAIALAFIVSSITCAILVIFRHSWAYMFNDDPEVVKTVAGVLPIIAFYQIIDGNACVTAGVLRAKGDQFLGALLNISAYYVIGLPIGVWLAFWVGFGLSGLWIGLSVALVYCAAVGSYLCLTTDWNREVKKVMERLEEEDKLRKAVEEEARLD